MTLTIKRKTSVCKFYAMVLGIDEAGRGPVLGPMIIVGLQVGKADIDKLKAMGVKDSKLLSPKRREQLDVEIRKIARNIVIKTVEAQDIDRLRALKSLNQIELEEFAAIIKEVGDDEVYLDLPEPGKKWTATLRQKIKRPMSKFVAEHKADVNYPIVGAASIIAKVERDRRIRELEKELGMEIGSGYPADPHTMNFLRKWMQTHKDIPPWVRKSWRTARELWGLKKQKPLTAFKKKKQKALTEF